MLQLLVQMQFFLKKIDLSHLTTKQLQRSSSLLKSLESDMFHAADSFFEVGGWLANPLALI